MIILGIADNHDSGAAIVIDGRLVSAVNQERIDRIKQSGAFPWGAIDAALALAGVSEREVDRIVVGSSFTPSAILRAFPERHHQAKSGGQFSPWLHAYIVYQSSLKMMGMHNLEVDACRRVLRRRLMERPFSKASIEMMDHHRAHAEGAYRTQAHSHCLVLTVDAMGDGTTATASMGRDGQLDLLWRQSGMTTINTFYSRVTERLGFTAIRHEGKVTGLAALAPPPPGLLDHFAKEVHFVGPGFSRMRVGHVDRVDDAFWSVLDSYTREEVASAAQQILEDCVCAYVSHWVGETGCRKLAVAGGVFANVKLNQRICTLAEVDTLWVMPHMGDGGLPAGAALGSVGASPSVLAHAYLGPDFSDKEIRAALSVAGLPKRKSAAPIARVAKLLEARQVVARFDGGMEWGPRALGNRTLLARPDDPAVNDSLNARLGRSEFMPFAPVVRAEDTERYFVGVEKAAAAARFMTVCFDATDEFKQTCAAAVHVDGSARPQIVHEADNPSLHALLGEMGERTGTPVLINTSFNLHEEPIVCSPSDAIRAWQKGKLDALWMGAHVLTR